MKKALSCILTIALLITVMAPCLFLQAQETGTGLYDKVLEEDGFIYGVNLPWISQGDDGSTWAANAITGAASSFDETKLKKTLYDIRAIGFTGIRIHLFRGQRGTDEKPGNPTQTREGVWLEPGVCPAAGNGPDL